MAIRVTGETEHTAGTATADEKGREWASSTTATAREVKELRGLLLRYRPAA